MSIKLGNGIATFGNGSVQSVAQFNNYAYTNANNIVISRNGSYSVQTNLTAGPQGVIHVFVDVPWTCTEDNGLTEHFLNFQYSTDSVNYTTLVQQYQYSSGYSGRYTGGNFSLSWAITGLTPGSTYWVLANRQSGTCATENWFTIMAYGV